MLLGPLAALGTNARCGLLLLVFCGLSVGWVHWLALHKRVKRDVNSWPENHVLDSVWIPHGRSTSDWTCPAVDTLLTNDTWGELLA